jgi:opacity protein-like surface antigen
MVLSVRKPCLIALTLLGAYSVGIDSNYATNSAVSCSEEVVGSSGATHLNQRKQSNSAKSKVWLATKREEFKRQEAEVLTLRQSIKAAVRDQANRLSSSSDPKCLEDPKRLVSARLRSEELKARDLVRVNDEILLREDNVTVEMGTGLLTSLYPIGFNDANYTLFPNLITIGWQLDDVSGQGWLRGNTQFNFMPHWIQVVHGYENRFVGFMAGPQYNFAPEGSRFSPFIGAAVGFSFVDSQLVGEPGNYGGQGQDFCFTFSVRVGVRYWIVDQLMLGVALYYQHWSNADLSEPNQRNHGLDGIGPVLLVSYNF